MDYTDLHIIIVAGGSGTRMNSTTPKQFLDIGNGDILTNTIRALSEEAPQAHYVVVVHADYLDREKKCSRTFPNLHIEFVEGGQTRFESSKAGLARCPREGYIFIHDAARPFIDAALIRRLYQGVKENGSAIPVIPVTSSLRIVDGDENHAIDRMNYRVVQTPQAFRADWIQDAFDTEWQPTFSDDATVLEASGKPIFLVPGDEHNFKITSPLDLENARRIVAG